MKFLEGTKVTFRTIMIGENEAKFDLRKKTDN